MNRIFSAIAVLALSAFPVAAQRPETGFLDRTLTVEGVTYRYQVYVPVDYSADKKWPVVLFLHGAGERGDDGLVQTNVGIGTDHTLFALKAGKVKFSKKGAEGHTFVSVDAEKAN